MAFYLADGVTNPAGSTPDDLLDKIIEVATLAGWSTAYDSATTGDERTVSLVGVGDADVNPYASFKIKQNGGVNNLVIRCSTGWDDAAGFNNNKDISLGSYDSASDRYYSTVFTLGDVEFPFFVQATDNSIKFGADTGLAAVFAYVGFTDRDPYLITPPEEFPFSVAVITSTNDSFKNDKTALGCATLSDNDTGNAYYSGCAYLLNKWMPISQYSTAERADTARSDSYIFSILIRNRGTSYLSVNNPEQYYSNDLGQIKLDRIYLSQNQNPYIHFLKDVYLINGYQMPRFGLMRNEDQSRQFIVLQPTNSLEINRFYCVELI